MGEVGNVVVLDGELRSVNSTGDEVGEDTAPAGAVTAGVEEDVSMESASVSG